MFVNRGTPVVVVVVVVGDDDDVLFLNGGRVGIHSLLGPLRHQCASSSSSSSSSSFARGCEEEESITTAGRLISFVEIVVV